jgi:hypothetical protein
MKLCGRIGASLLAAGLLSTAMVDLLAGEKSAQAVTIFNGKNLSGWVGFGGEATNWEVVDNELRTKQGREGVRLLMTDRDFDDFEFSMEFNAPVDVNTGVFFRLPADGEGRPAFVGNEIQIVDEKSELYKGKMTEDRRMGAHYSVAPPLAEPPALRPGEWQKFRIRCVGSSLKVWIDDVLLQDADMATYPEVIKREHPGLLRTSGRIGLQSKGTVIRFRNLRIVEIGAK